GETVLATCARAGSLEGVKALLARGADPNGREKLKGQTVLMWAALQKHPDVVRTLVERGADVHLRSLGGFTPLLFAAQQGDIETAKVLLAAGADINETTPESGSALVVAAASGHEALAIFLLDRGAKPDMADGYGITALHFTVPKGL